MDKFKDLRIVDNFYQTSSFFPMPTVVVSTVSENGMTNFGSYSICFPYYIAGKEYYAMLLECRNSSNTAQNILRTGKATLNFIPDDRKLFREAVRLGFPGETTEQKMKDCLFTLVESDLGEDRPKIAEEAYQVFECTWDSSLENAFEDKPGQLEGYEPPYRDFNGITSKFGAHFILKIDRILMKDKYRDSIINGVKAKGFPRVPVDYGYRDSTNFWYTKFSKPRFEPIASSNSGSVESVMYCAERLDTKVKFTREACELYVKIPRPFMKAALMQIVEIAEREGIEVIDKEAAERIAEIRRKSK